MIVIVKKTVGTFGHKVNGMVTPRTWKNGLFEVTDEKGAELLARGIVDKVESVEESAPAPAPAAEKPRKASKKAKAAAPAAADEVPSLNPADAVE